MADLTVGKLFEYLGRLYAEKLSLEVTVAELRYHTCIPCIKDCCKEE